LKRLPQEIKSNQKYQSGIDHGGKLNGSRVQKPKEMIYFAVSQLYSGTELSLAFERSLDNRLTN